MTYQTLARQHYNNSQRELASEKAVEIRVFSSITSRLRAVDMNAIGAMSQLAEILNENVKLWNILLVDVTRPENMLPHSLKTSLISLAEFTQSHTLKVFAGEATQEVLIDINTAVLNGLRASLKNETGQNQPQMKVA